MRDLNALLRFIAEREAMPFAWGHNDNDCVSFAFGAVAAQRGSDPLDLIGDSYRWASLRGAVSRLRKAGGLEAAVTHRLTPIGRGMAMRGDVAGVIERPAAAGQPGREFGIALMIVEGDTLVGPGPNGIQRLPRRAMTMAWSAI